jgi:peroxiredoxin
MSTNPTDGIKQEIGVRMEGFSLASIQGEEFSLDQIVYDRKGAVIIFWSSTCSHCMRYDSYLNGFRQEYPELGIAVIASRERETLTQLRAAAAGRKLKFPILCDPGALIAKKWFAQQTPRAFFIDKDHLLRYRGAIDNYRYPQDPDYVAYLQPAITEFLAGKPVSRTESASFGCAIQSIYYNLPKAL